MAELSPREFPPPHVSMLFWLACLYHWLHVSTRVSRSPTLAAVTRAPATVAILQTLQLGEVSRGRYTRVIRGVQLLQQHKTFIPDTRGGVNIICVPCNHLDTYTWVNDLLRRRPRLCHTQRSPSTDHCTGPLDTPENIITSNWFFFSGNYISEAVENNFRGDGAIISPGHWHRPRCQARHAMMAPCVASQGHPGTGGPGLLASRWIFWYLANVPEKLYTV